jgi:DNA topoisomerase VI subunit B
MEFCTKRELQNQTGHSVYQWLLVLLKELMDNALDACEEAEVAPVISIKVNPDFGTIIIQDNADGIETDTIKPILDYTIRVSSREAYVSPTRGAQGNALKTVLAMGYVLNREKANSGDAVGVTIIETRGVKHRLKFEVDHINLQPRITHDIASSLIKVGTKITVKWPPKAELFSWAARDFKELAESCTWFNPHLTLSGFWNGEQFINVKATNPRWEKW